MQGAVTIKAIHSIDDLPRRLQGIDSVVQPRFGRPEGGHDPIATILVQRTAVLEDGPFDERQIASEKVHDLMRCAALGNLRKADDIDENDGNILVANGPNIVVVGGEHVDNVWRKVARKI